MQENAFVAGPNMDFLKLITERSKLSLDLGKIATVEETIDSLGTTKEQVNEVISQINEQIKQSKPWVDEEEYFEAIGEFELLTAEEEIELSQTIQLGKLESEWRFICSNLKLSAYWTKVLSYTDYPLEDRLHEANLGLMHALEKFDWEKGFKFSTYATHAIRRQIIGNREKERVKRIKIYEPETFLNVMCMRKILELSEGKPAPPLKKRSFYELKFKEGFPLLT